MMTALIELHFLPPVQFFTLPLRYSNVLIEQCEHYQKRSYRNRCHIASSQGVQRLSLPLQKGKNQQSPIREVRLAYDQNWPKQMAHAIRSAYRRAPFFEEYGPELLATLSQPREFLFDLNLALLEQIAQYLDIPANWSFTENYDPAPPPPIADLRNRIKPTNPAPDPGFQTAHYSQIFEDRFGFSPNLSIIDLLFCMGPEAASTLRASLADS